MSKKSQKPKTSARAERRSQERDIQKLIRDKERLFVYERGGSPDKAIELGSSSEVEVVARTMQCPRCEGAFEVLEHLAQTLSVGRLRVARVRCKVCGAERSLYFRLAGSMMN